MRRNSMWALQAAAMQEHSAWLHYVTRSASERCGKCHDLSVRYRRDAASAAASSVRRAESMPLKLIFPSWQAYS